MGKKIKDLTGQVFGRLTVLKRVEDYVSPNGLNKQPKFLCECSCNKENPIKKIIRSDSLRSGLTKSCGCLTKEKAAERMRAGQSINIGDKFGKLTVIDHADDRISSKGVHKTQFLCKCDCKINALKIVSSASLKSGHTKSCGCLKKAGININDKFGKLTVIAPAESYIEPNGKSISQFLCKCDCDAGTEIVVRGISLKNGNTRSCGCLRKKKG